MSAILIAAKKNRDLDVFELLVEAGADVNCVSGYFGDVVKILQANGDSYATQEVIEYLINAGYAKRDLIKEAQDEQERRSNLRMRKVYLDCFYWEKLLLLKLHHHREATQQHDCLIGFVPTSSFR